MENCWTVKRILGLSSWKTLLRRVAHCRQVAKHNHCLSVHSDVTILDHSAMHSRKHRDGDQNGGVIAEGRGRGGSSKKIIFSTFFGQKNEISYKLQE